MLETADKVDKAKEGAAKAAVKEETAQANDQIAKREADLIKATVRLNESAEFLGRIVAVANGVLPQIVGTHSLGQALDLFTQFEDAVSAVEKKYKEAKAIVDMAREVSFPARLDAEDTRSTTSADTGNRITRTARIFASILTDKQADAFNWLRNNGLGELIKETVNSSSLSGAAKEQIENGKELPDDIFRVHTKDGVSITRGKKG